MATFPASYRQSSDIIFSKDKGTTTLRTRWAIYRLLLLFALLLMVSGDVAQAVECPHCPPDPSLYRRPVVTLFYAEADPVSQKALDLLQFVQANTGYFDLDIREMKASGELRDLLNRMRRVEGSDQHEVPALYTDDGVFIGYHAIRGAARDLVRPEHMTPDTLIKRIYQFLEEIKLALIFNTDGVLVTIVVAAGIIDGFNPCALALLIFLLACLSLLPEQKAPYLTAGLSFIAGSFLAYFLLGLGMVKLTSHPLFGYVSDWMYKVLGVLTLLLGILSLLDAFRVKRKDAGKVVLRLPTKWRRGLQKILRRYALNQEMNIGIGFGLGFLASLMEFPCTGQVYLPTVALISTPQQGHRAMLYLLIYNTLFILPLVLVLFGSTFLTSQRVGKVFHNHLPLVKILTAVLFFVISAYMLGVLN
jgi:cytochrome c biogenesis protein CcdA